MNRLCSILFVGCLFHSFESTLGSPLYRLFDHQETHFDKEQCYFHSKDKEKSTIHYGVCTSINGPDGCCLDGHYEPGICPNLGHICCVKPDLDCSQMRNNKAITRQQLQQQKAMFRKKNSQSEFDTKSNEQDTSASRLVRSSNLPADRHPILVKSNFEVLEMPSHMNHDAIAFVTEGLEQSDGNYDDTAEYLCGMLDQKYPEPTPWACFIGKEYGYSVEAQDGKYMLFYMGNVDRIRVMAFIPKAPTPGNNDATTSTSTS